MIFTGTYEHAIDTKNRLAIPADIRAQLGDPKKAGGNQTINLFVTLGEGNVLCLYTEQGFEQRAGELDSSELDPDQLLEYEKVLFSLARRVEMDKQGRVRLPDNLLNMTNLNADVVLIGVKDHMEVHDRQTWHRHIQEVLARQPKVLMNPRRAMRNTASTPPHQT